MPVVNKMNEIDCISTLSFDYLHENLHVCIVNVEKKYGKVIIVNDGTERTEFQTLSFANISDTIFLALSNIQLFS